MASSIRTRQHLVPTAIAAAALVVASACAAPTPAMPQPVAPSTATSPVQQPTAQPPTVVPAPSTPPLAALVVQGGLCAGGACRSEVQILADGSWTTLEGGVSTRPGLEPITRGRLSASELSGLKDAIDATTLGTAPVSTEVCATASDGMELLISWAGSDGLTTVSSCERVVPVTDPLVVVLEALLHEGAV